MNEDYERYKKHCEKICKENERLLEEFADSLTAKGLSKTTVKRHCENMDFYLNHFMLNYDAERAEAGVRMVGTFLGDWFIRKAMWASQSSIKSNAVSLKKFYSFMVLKGKVRQEELDDLKIEISEGMPEWLATLARYDDPEIDDPNVIWGL